MISQTQLAESGPAVMASTVVVAMNDSFSKKPAAVRVGLGQRDWRTSSVARSLSRVRRVRSFQTCGPVCGTTSSTHFECCPAAGERAVIVMKVEGVTPRPSG